jgi:hypothetical protein
MASIGKQETHNKRQKKDVSIEISRQSHRHLRADSTSRGGQTDKPYCSDRRHVARVDGRAEGGISNV